MLTAHEKQDVVVDDDDKLAMMLPPGLFRSGLVLLVLLGPSRS